MCCNNRTHVIVISIIWLVLTGISAIRGMVLTILAYTSGDEYISHVHKTFGVGLDLYVGILVVVHIIWITSEILSIVGAVKNKRWLLVPFMICSALQIVGCIGGLIVVVSVFSGKSDPASALVCIIPLLILLGISIYFVSIVKRFHDQLSYEGGSAVHPGKKSDTDLFHSTVL